MLSNHVNLTYTFYICATIGRYSLCGGGGVGVCVGDGCVGVCVGWGCVWVCVWGGVCGGVGVCGGGGVGVCEALSLLYVTSTQAMHVGFPFYRLVSKSTRNSGTVFFLLYFRPQYQITSDRQEHILG